MRPNAMMLLNNGVPITLLLDLADPEHLPSRTICLREGGAAEWLAAPRPRARTVSRRAAATRGVVAPR